jgi:hypothetical protein
VIISWPGLRHANQGRRAACVHANTELIASLAFARSARIALSSRCLPHSLAASPDVECRLLAKGRLLARSSRQRRAIRASSEMAVSEDNLQRLTPTDLVLGAYRAAKC